MKKFYFTPGPSELYFTVPAHINNAVREGIPSISHRSKQFENLYKHAVNGLRSLLQLSDDYHIFFTSSATEIWERIIQNMVFGESFHLVNGAFSSKFQHISQNLNKNAMSMDVSHGQVVDVEKLLIPESAELIAVTQNETSTGASQPVEDIYKLRAAFPDQLLAVDLVSAAPYTDLDFSKVDTAYFSVQKCFGLPAGLGVWIVNERCFKKCEQIMNEGKSVGSYHSLPELREKAEKNQTPETPNVLNIYLLGKVVEDMLTKGIDAIRRETDYKAAVLYNAFEKSEHISPFVLNPKYQSKTTPVAQCDISSKKILDKLASKGFVLGSGYGKFKDHHIRIANFPTHSKEHVEMIADLLIDQF